MKKFYLHDGSAQQGPFDIEELKSKNITRDTPIWYDSIPDWTTAGNVEELKSILSTTPPPFGTKIAMPPPVQKPVTQQKVVVDKPKQKSSTGRRLLILAGIVVLVLVGVFVYNQIQHQQQQTERQNELNAEEDTKTRIKNNITSYVTAERNEYTYSNLGGIYNLKITVTNSTDYVIDNVKVKITYIKANGDVWDTRLVDFNMIDPQTKVTQKIADTERGTSINYEIVSIKSNALGLN